MTSYTSPSKSFEIVDTGAGFALIVPGLGSVDLSEDNLDGDLRAAMRGEAHTWDAWTDDETYESMVPNEWTAQGKLAGTYSSERGWRFYSNCLREIVEAL